MELTFTCVTPPHPPPPAHTHTVGTRRILQQPQPDMAAPKTLIILLNPAILCCYFPGGGLQIEEEETSGTASDIRSR